MTKPRQSLVSSLRAASICRLVPAILAVTLGTITSSGATNPPNVVMILADDLGNADISRNASAGMFRHTPNLDRICNQGIYLKQYLTHHVCSPSRAGILTGRHYTRVGGGSEVGGTLDNTIPNVAKDLKANGYKTGIFGKWHNSFRPMSDNGKSVKVASLSEVIPNDDIYQDFKNIAWGEGPNAYGFDEWAGFYGGGGDYFNRFDSWSGENDWWINNTFSPHVTGYTTDIIADDSLAFINANHTGPFFLYVPMQGVHNPLHIKRSDLQELCALFPGQWDYIKNVTSPTTGRRIENVEELRCAVGDEFDYSVIDPNKTRFARLVYSTLAYSMDKAVGRILTRLEELNLESNTIIWFASDNGASPLGDNSPYRGYKYSPYEGGTHVPAAVWWPGQLDSTSAPYAAAGNNNYNHLFQYLDFYPTVMAMAGLPIQGTGLDGLNMWPALQSRTTARPDFENCFFDMHTNWAIVRNSRYKLHFNRISGLQTRLLYDLQTDPDEGTNIQGSQTAVRDTMIALLDNWFSDGSVTASFMPLNAALIPYPDPAPADEVLEIKATQTGTLNNEDTDGVYIYFTKPAMRDYESYIQAGDRYEFDVYVAEDSDKISGFYCTPAKSWLPYYDSDNGVNSSQTLVSKANLPKGQWVRQVVGIGNLGALPASLHFIALRNKNPGYYHFYIDNLVLRKSDGTVRGVFWKNSSDGVPGNYLYKNIKYSSWAAVSGVSGFPFSNITITPVSAEAATSQNNTANQSASLTPGSGSGIDYSLWAASTNATVGTANNNTTANAQLGDINNTSQVRRSVFAFDLEAAGVSTQLLSATLKLYYRGSGGNANTVGGAVSMFHGQSQTVAADATSAAILDTFNLANWTDTGLNIIGSPSATSSRYYSVDVTSQVLADLNNDPAGSAMSHFMIRWDNEGATNAFLTFDAVEGTAGDPVLELTFAPAPPAAAPQQFSDWAGNIGGLAGNDPTQPGPVNTWPLLTEYALGTNPTTPTQGFLPASSSSAEESLGTYQFDDLGAPNPADLFFTMSFALNLEADDVQIALRESGDLATWAEPLVLSPPYDGSTPSRSLSGPGSLATHPNVVSISTSGADPNIARITVRSSGAVQDATAGFHSLEVRPTVNVAAAPTGLRSSIHSGILLEWNGSVEKGIFVVQRAPAGSNSFVSIGQSEATQFTDATAVAGETYDYRVCAMNAAGASPCSEVVTATR